MGDEVSREHVAQQMPVEESPWRQTRLKKQTQLRLIMRYRKPPNLRVLALKAYRAQGLGLRV